MVELMPDPDADRVVKPALHAYRDEAHTAFVPPHFGAVRTAARSRYRRRFATVVTAAAAVAAVAGVAVGATLVRSTVAQPPPAVSPTVAEPPPTAAPRPSTAPPSAAPTTPGRAITDVDWPNATITMGPTTDNRWCPAGAVRLRNGEGTLGGVHVWLWKDAKPSYGDLDGDGAPEAVLPLACAPAEGAGDWSGNLTAVTMQGTELTVLGYAGPLGNRFSGYRVTDGKLVTQVRPMHDAWAAEQRRTYQWNGVRFTQVAGPREFVDLRDAAVTLKPIGRGSDEPACPGGTAQFRGGTATVGSATYRLGAGPPLVVDVEREAQFADLTGDGNAEVLLPIRCTVRGLTGGGLYVLTLLPEGRYEVLDIPFTSYPWAATGRGAPSLVGYELSANVLRLVVRDGDTAPPRPRSLRWTGEHFA